MKCAGPAEAWLTGLGYRRDRDTLSGCCGTGGGHFTILRVWWRLLGSEAGKIELENKKKYCGKDVRREQRRGWPQVDSTTISG